jgi:hypothetical protein
LWRRADSQEVGLEAAILERVRNSSLVEWHRAENVPGLKPPTEAADGRAAPREGRGGHGRGAFGSSGEARAGALVERTEARMPE